jgi:hypothetical protein
MGPGNEPVRSDVQLTGLSAVTYVDDDGTTWRRVLTDDGEIVEVRV